jgi:tRNA G18 (ribose-2'-O)-methylase SpoU
LVANGAALPAPFLDQADLKVQIPYGRSFSYSLGAAAATAVISFEVARQRRQTPGKLPQ